MRRTVAAAALALALAATGTISAYADSDLQIESPEVVPSEPEAPTPEQVLDRAEAALDGEVTGTRRPEATLALRDLFATLPRLSGTDRAAARRILARPTQGANDPYGDGYTVDSRRRCAKRICIHWVPTTSDAPPSERWVNRSLRVVKQVWRTEVSALGYRRPVRDGRRGGNGKLDVYLADVGSQGLYGYCAPEVTKPGFKRLASGFCVLDNDFSRSEFGGRPINTLKVTAAHEFFHTVQFAYDYLEDPWLMEATATWIEERYADGVNDNRQYLPRGQLVRTWVALDTFKTDSVVQYGNWVFFEYLTERFGNRIVRRIWNQAGHFRGDGKTYSTSAVQRVLPRKAPFAKVFAQFSAANLTPARSYPEGLHWPRPALVSHGALGRGEGTSGTLVIDHLSSHDIRVTPEKSLGKRKFKLRVRIDGPARRTDPMATVVWQQRSGKITKLPVRLNKRGKGSKVVPFNRRQTRRVWLVLSNASTRFDCRGNDVTYSCSGTPRDDNRAFRLRLRVVTRR
ncbi:MXAN_6640 family putative metalloprotease [Nocardioides sp.]|uniref:MXAN_6640 family putative metalloprotease n=1 Tax=Nocardioides sp. TaxID=35761 RepID=UPI002ED5F21D